jgi:hypothetical protein
LILFGSDSLIFNWNHKDTKRAKERCVLCAFVVKRV